MGYILPVTHYTYHNYQQRIIADKKSPHYVDAPFRVEFNKIKDTYDCNERKLFRTILHEKEKQLQNDPHLFIAIKEKAKLTGKGRQVNEQI